MRVCPYQTLNSVFELFRLRDKEVPIEVIEFSKDTSVAAFAWEPKGIRYAVIHGEPGSARSDVSLKVDLLIVLNKIRNEEDEG